MTIALALASAACWGIGVACVGIGGVGLARTLIYDLRDVRGETPAGTIVPSSVMLGIGCAWMLIGHALGMVMKCPVSP